MTHGHGKSDSAIVAGKLANNAEQSVAEPAERTSQAEGNATQQSTDRTESRADVSQALARVRKPARERKKERFTALFHHLSMRRLAQAFFELKEDVSPGVDRLTWKG